MNEDRVRRQTFTSISMTGTSTLTVIIGDSNDNKMQPGSKDILVYNYMVSASAFDQSVQQTKPCLKYFPNSLFVAGSVS